MVELITTREEEALFDKLIEYYKRLYPGIAFNRDKAALQPKQVGELLYTYPGEEAEATFLEKVRSISEAVTYGYDTPVIILRKKSGDILLDGHRRIKVAWDNKIPWKALVILPSKELKFGIEKMVQGRVKEIWGR